MTTSALTRPVLFSPPPNIVILLNIVWSIVIAAGSGYLGFSILRMEGTFYDLGRPVQVFAGVIALVPAVLALLSVLRLARNQAGGRYIALILDYGSMIAALILLVHLWGLFIGIDAMARALRDNIQWLLGLPLAYGVYWIAGRLPEDMPIRRWLELAALAIAGAALILLLWFGNAIAGFSAVLGTYSNPLVWLVTGVAILTGLLGYWLLHLGQQFRETPAQQEAWQGWLMLSPNIIGFMLFFAGPLLLSFYLSFTNDSVGNVPEFIGLQNYVDILSLQVRTQTDLNASPKAVLDNVYTPLYSVQVGDTRYVLGAKDYLFWYSIRNTLIYCLLLMPLSVLPALILALILNSRLPGMKFYRAVYFLPSVAAVVGTALIWRWLYDPTIGYINYAITQLANWLGVADPKISWLTDANVMLLSLVLMGAWQVVGFNTVLFLAGLQNVPKILYEAAYVDGANGWERFRYVTLPLLRPTTFFVIITTAITGLQVFNEPYALISQRPMPENATTAVFYLYNRGFFRFEFGYASAVAWILFALIFTVTLIQFRIQQSRGFDAYAGG